jgi:hypothetical protein
MFSYFNVKGIAATLQLRLLTGLMNFFLKVTQSIISLCQFIVRKSE